MLGKTIRVPRHVELSEPGWRRTKPPLTSSCIAKGRLASLEVRNRAVLGYEPESAVQSRSPLCILLWSPSKKQRFIGERHPRASFGHFFTAEYRASRFLSNAKGHGLCRDGRIRPYLRSSSAAWRARVPAPHNFIWRL